MKWQLFCGVAALALTSSAARADRLIWIPTADISRPSIEYMADPFGKAGVATGQIGLGKQFELLVRDYKDYQLSNKTEVGGQFTVLPEGFATPGVALGVWDVGNDGPRGRRIFGVITKSLPVINKLPTGFHDFKVDAGVGSGKLSGVFLGGQAGIPFGFGVTAEFDSRHFNAGLSWSPIGIVRFKAESWAGKLFIGAQLRSPVKL